MKQTLAILLALSVAMLTTASAQTYTPFLHVFGDGSTANDGANPTVALITGLDGNYYGMTSGGGTTAHGTVFKMTPQGVVTLLHSFKDPNVTNDGFNPSILIQTPDGDLWGTTTQGGTSYPSAGTIFKITPQGTYSIVYAFQGGNDGTGPDSLVLGTDGNFYGASYSGGFNNGNTGCFWKMTPQGVLTPIYSFASNGTADGEGPGGSLVEGTDGAFYGTCGSGQGQSSLDGGIIYKMSPAGVRTVVQGFLFGEGGPLDGLKAALDGNMYGMTSGGGTSSGGTVYKLAAQSTFSVVYNFGSNSTLDGADPVGNVTLATDGNLYGATSEVAEGGGKGGSGLVFQVSPQGQTNRGPSIRCGRDLRWKLSGNRPRPGTRRQSLRHDLLRRPARQRHRLQGRPHRGGTCANHHGPDQPRGHGGHGVPRVSDHRRKQSANVRG